VEKYFAMFFRKIIFLFCCFFAVNTFSQSTDSLIHSNELVFNSDYEKQVFTEYFRSQKHSDLLPFFMAGYEKFSPELLKSTQKTIDDLVEEFRPKISGSKNTAKSIKLIYTTVHDRLLKKYELVNHFGDIFTNGNYNCVSASALYGLILQKLNIPFVIKELPTHVYLVAYPTTEKIIIETTDPNRGYLQINDEFRDDFLNRLLKAKMISKSEYEGSSKEALFKKYFFSEQEDIDLFKLAGLQYHNDGIYTFEKKPLEAYHYFSKAYFLYPGNRNSFLIEQSLRRILSKAEYKNFDEVKYYAKLTEFNKDTIEVVSRKQLYGEFAKLTNNQLVEYSDTKLYDKSYQYVRQHVRDTALQKDIDFLYNFETARLALNSSKTEGVDKKIEIIYRLKPQNADVRNIITYYIFNRLSKQSNPKELLSGLESYVKPYPFLTENEKFNQALCLCYLDIAGQSFNQNNLKKGEENLQLFEQTVKKYALTMDGNLVARSYAEASSAYFRLGNYAKSKQLLQKGLEYAPGNYMLETRLSQMR
jgi:hypothetical protein